MNKASIHILGIAPYDAMKTTMEQIAHTYPNVCLDVFIGDLQAGVDIVKNNLQNAYDCIISRGGTAELIRKITDIPVVDIPLSVYDVLRTIKLAENYSKRYAIVGFPSITESAHTLCDLLRYEADILTVHSTEDIYVALSKLREEGCYMVVCDMATQAIAHRLNMDAFLITSGVESIQTALEQAVTLSAGFRRLRQESFFLRCVTRDENGSIAVLDEHGDTYYCVPAEPKEELLTVMRTKLSEIPTGKVLRFYHNDQGDLYTVNVQIVTIGQEKYYLFHYVSAKIPLRSGKLGIRAFNRGECEHLINTGFFAVSGAMGALESALTSIAPTRQPVMIVGEAGTGWEEIARYLYVNSPLSHRPFVMVDCELINDKSWDFLINHYNSPLNDSGGTVYIQHLETLTHARQTELLSLILGTGIIRRQRLVFSCVCSGSSEIPEAGRLYTQRLGCIMLELPNLRSRADEIPLLASLQLSKLNMHLGKQISGFEPGAMEQLRQFSWQNNYAQFRKVLESAASLTHSAYISNRTIAELLTQERNLTCVRPVSEPIREEQSLKEIVQAAIRQTLAYHKGNQTAAAKQLGISRTTMWRYINQGENENDADCKE